MTGGRVQYKNGLICLAAQRLLHSATDLAEFIHQIGLRVQSSGGVGDHHVGAACLRRLDRVKHHSPGVRAGLRLDKIHSDSVRPNLQLLYGCRAESVPCSKDYFLSLFLEEVRHFCYGCSLSDTVDPYKQVDRWTIGRQRQSRGCLAVEHIDDERLQFCLDVVGVTEPFLADRFSEGVYELSGGVDTEVGLNEQFLQLVKQVVIDWPSTCEELGHLAESVLEKSHLCLAVESQHDGFTFRSHAEQSVVLEVCVVEVRVVRVVVEPPAFFA